MRIGVDADVTESTVPMAELGRAIEDAGLDSLFVTQRTHLPVSQRELLDDPGHQMDAHLLDPFVALTAAAMATNRIWIGTGACYAAVYDPLLLARQVASVDQVSGGRFQFGVTPGWDEDEVRDHGVDPAVRREVMRENVLAVRRLWTEPEASFEGTYVHVPPTVLGLRPRQDPYPAILVGSHGRSGLRQAVEYGDEWFPILNSRLDLDRDVAELGRLCEAAGRPLLPITVFAWEADEAALECAARHGVSRALVYVYPKGRRDLDEALAVLVRLAARFA